MCPNDPHYQSVQMIQITNVSKWSTSPICPNDPDHQCVQMIHITNLSKWSRSPICPNDPHHTGVQVIVSDLLKTLIIHCTELTTTKIRLYNPLDLLQNTASSFFNCRILKFIYCILPCYLWPARGLTPPLHHRSPCHFNSLLNINKIKSWKETSF